MSEGTIGTAFFGVDNNFVATGKDFEQLEIVVNRVLSSIRTQFGSFKGVDFNPLNKVYENVNQQAGLIERRLQELFRKYQTFAKQGQTPQQPFALAANEAIGKRLAQVDKTLTSQAGNLGDVDLAELRRTLINGLAEGGTAAARELQSQLRTALKESGQGAQAAAFAGSPNTLRAGVVAGPLLKDVPEAQTAQDFVAATKAATAARQKQTKASEDSAAADEQAAKAATAAAAAGGKGGGAAPPPPPPPSPPEPPSPPPPPDGPAGPGGGFEEVTLDVKELEKKAQKKAVAALRQRIQEGVASFVNSGSAVYDPLGPTAAKGHDIVSATSAKPLPPIIADRLRQQVEAEVKQLQDEITSGDKIKLGSRFATPRPGLPGSGVDFTSLSTAHEVDNDKDVAAAQNLYAEHLRKAAADTTLEQVAENERRLAQELLRLAEDVAAKRKAGVLGPETGVRLSGQNIIDERAGSPVVFNRTPTGGVNQLIPELQPLRFASVLLADQEKILAAESAATSKALREEAAAARALEASQRAAEAAQRAAVRETSRTGIGNNFLSGLTSGGFSGDGTSGIDGLARAAGTTAKYSTLYRALGLVQQGLQGAVQGFLDANDSITEYQVATGKADSVTAAFQTNLEGVAEVSGFNVGEAMDVAAKAVRAFGDEVKATGQGSQDDIDRMSEGFAKQATRLATLSKTTLTDAAGNLTAVASGFQLPKNDVGFARVTDAIAGAKLAGGGDEKEIFQGLANSAIVFKQLGFNLNESATILSKINAQTDEGGQLIATRLSRLTSVLNGTSAGNFITSLNQQLPKDERIDRTAPARDQLIKLSEAYGKLSEAQKGALVSSLGGTAQERELTVLLQELPQIVSDANKIQPGAGLKEFETRLTNVRAILKEIQGFVKTIIVNLTTSGLADPIVGLVYALRGALDILSGLSKGFKELADLLSVNIGGANVSIVTLISSIGALGLALKGLATIRAAGGIRGAIGAAEERVAPGRALARQQLAGINGAQGTPATTPPGTLLAGVQGRAAQAAQAADHALALPRGVEADRDVRGAGDDVHAAAQRLAAAEDAQAALINRQTEQRRAFAAANPGDNAGLHALTQEQAAERQQAAQRGIVAQLDLTTAQAQLARALRVQAAQAEVAAEFDARRASITGQFQKQIGGTIGQFQAAEAKGDARGVQAAFDREARLREQFNERLAALEAEQIAAEQRATTLANATLRARVIDAGSNGGLAAATLARQEGAGIIRTATAFSGTVISGIGRGLTSLYNVIGGPVGVGLIAADFGLQVKGAVDDINKARKDLQNVNTQFENKPPTVQNLRENAANEASGGQNIREASGGIFGFLANLFVNNGQGSQRDIDAANRQAAASTKAADALDALQAALRTGQSGKGAAASTLDITDSKTLQDTFNQLQAAGFDAAGSFDVLIERIKQFRLVVTSTAQLTDFEKGQLAQGAGREAVTAVTQLPDTKQFVDLGGGRGSTISTPASDFINSGALQDRVTKIATGQIAAGTDLGSAPGKAALERALIKGYTDLVPNQAYATALAHKIGDSAYKMANDFATQVQSVAQLQTAVELGFTAAESKSQEAQKTAQLSSLTGGTRDTSAVTGAQSRLQALVQLRTESQAKLQQLVAAGQQPSTILRSDLRALNDKIIDAQIQQAQAITQRAQQAIADSNAVRRAEQSKATTNAQMKAIGQKFFQADIHTALATRDIDTIVSVFNNASKAEVDAILHELDEVVKTKEAAAQAAAARARAAAALASVINTSTRDVAGGAADQIINAGDRAAIAAANRAAREAADARGQANAAHQAAKQANPQNIYDTGTDRNNGGGATLDQIAAANAQAQAVRDRNSTEGLRAAVQAAQADYAAAKDQKSKAEALQQLYAAENALTDGLKAVAVARRFVNTFPASAVQSATKAVAEARNDLTKYARGTLEYYQALGQLVQAQRQLSEAQGAAYFLRQKLRTDLTDPVAQARLAVREAASKLRGLQREGAPSDLQDQAKLDLKNAQNQAESAAFSQRLSDAQTNDELGRISHAAYLRYLNNEHNRLTAIRHRTRQQQDELNQVDQAIKSATQELQGQFNLGDIKVPTPYEVRRYIATQAKSATLTATAAAAAGSAAAGSSGGVTITVNGADVAFVRRVLSEYLGPSATSTRAVTASRKG